MQREARAVVSNTEHPNDPPAQVRLHASRLSHAGSLSVAKRVEVAGPVGQRRCHATPQHRTESSYSVQPQMAADDHK